MRIRLFSLYITIFARKGKIAANVAGHLAFWQEHTPGHWFTSWYLGPICINADWVPGVDDIDPFATPWFDVS